MDTIVQIILFDEEDLSKTLIESYLKEVTFSYKVAKFNEFQPALIPNDNDKKIIIVNVNKTNNKVLSEISKLSQNKNNLFLLISYDKSADLQVNVLRTGAKDFLFKPLIQADFINSLMKIYNTEIKKNPDNSKSMVYSVLSIEPSVGKTTFSFNLAYELAELSKEKVLLVDFNNDINDLNSMIDVQINFNTPYYVNKLTKENAQELLSKVPRYKKSSLYVMANGNYRNSESNVDEGKIANFLEVVKKHYKFIIIDVDSASVEQTSELIDGSDLSYFVIIASLTSIGEVKKYLDKNFYCKMVRVILNKLNFKKDEPLINQIEQKLQRQIFYKIPKNILVTSAASENRSSFKEVAPKLDIVRAYDEIAQHMINKDL
ncbi:MAG: hypothetical protein E7Z90_06750 [Cyanobacteria bacterium SIG29]|nr:hypothetical protein [Cyanobacteria bacterium SIG29]